MRPYSLPRAGDLNRRIIIQSATTTQDANGEPVQSWSTFATVWAKVTDISGREFVLSGGVQNEVQTKILIRYLFGVLPAMRIVDGSRTYTVEAVLEQGNRAQQLMCSRLS